jgi:hypothetical protein
MLNKIIKNNIFAFDLKNEKLTFGDILYKGLYNFTDVIVDNQELWKIELESFIVNKFDICKTYRDNGSK